MKSIIILVLSLSLLAACQTADKKVTGKELSAEEKNNALKDSADYTSIQWIDSTFQSLGKVKEGGVVEVSYRFRNTGTKNLVIANVSAQCGCTIPETPKEPIAPGAEGVIKAKFDSKGRPKGEARKEVYVTANTNPQNSTLTFSVEITD